MAVAPSILVVEDERPQREALVKYLAKQGLDAHGAPTAEAGLDLLAERQFGALITDLRLPGMDGVELLRRARQLQPDICVFLVTAFASVETAVEALRAGAHDYILKPLFNEEVLRKLRNALEHRELLRENVRLRVAVQRLDDHELIGGSAGMKQVVTWVQRAAESKATVLITGETGTGKEVVARAIHRLGPHSDQPMLSVNVAALSESVVESELFGHERGAFTGADRQRLGILRAASAGTVFLDEIAELALPVQAKLLRALEAREVMPVGGEAAIPFEARILCATHRDLLQRVRGGEFREDLYYRVNVLRIELPALRERREDIPALAEHVLTRLARRQGRAVPTISVEAMQALMAYRWPGNVRELANVLERALILATDGGIGPELLPSEMRDAEAPGGSTLQEATDRFERSHIATTLRECQGNRERAAKQLGLSPATLYRKIERLGLKGFMVNDG
jgi:DNA-binding NtrC family response regulator